jgi:protein-tyrosine phosphatase
LITIIITAIDVQNGDLNWIVEGKIMAFAGPSHKKTISPEGYCTLAPSDYIPYFKKKNVALVIRLNKKNYDETEFIKAGMQHLEQFYLDGSCPPMNILHKVVAEMEKVPQGKAFAVHCKAGLGRTGTCIGAYIMKHYRFTAPECIAWMRICRPGMVIGPQQQFLQDLEQTMWQEGELMRSTPTSHSIRTYNNNNKYPGRLELDLDLALDLELELDPPSSPPQTNMTDKEAVVGRAGQADELLARRHRQTQGQGTPKAKPVPITPDSTTGKSAPQWVKSA